MRLDPKRVSLTEAVQLFEFLSANSPATFHSSHEYPFHSYFCEALSTFRQRNPGREIIHIAKLASPHFDEVEFSRSIFKNRIDTQLKALGADRLDIVQWLVRHTPNEDTPRLVILERCQEELASITKELITLGKIGALAVFPYSEAFAEKALLLPECQGLATYLNLSELEMVPLLDSMFEQGQGFITIRPLLAGLITPDGLQKPLPNLEQEKRRNHLSATFETLNIEKNRIPEFSLRFSLLHPAVTSVIVSISSIKHAEPLLKAALEVEPDRESFAKLASSFQGK
jgi:aryl-alcohol dehydrogenase-like predicted oxidoreductase